MRYPYFINPDIEALSSAEGEERVRLMRRIAVNVGDETALRAIIGIDPEEFRNFYPDMNPPELSTEDTISSFIDRFASEKQAATPQIEEIIAAPAVNYASMLADEEEETLEETDEPDATSDAISAFLEAVPPKTPVKRKSSVKAEDSKHASEETPTNSPDLTEALFKLMVKNKNYTKALEIINEISLNNPKKSIYFAYQKRFLEKLIKIGK